MDYNKILEETFATVLRDDEVQLSRLEFLSESIFRFIAFDAYTSTLFARKAVELCEAVTKGTMPLTPDSPDGELLPLLILNSSFFHDKLDLRGLFSDKALWAVGTQAIFALPSTVFVSNGVRWDTPIVFSREQWKDFIAAIIAFAKPEMVETNEPSA